MILKIYAEGNGDCLQPILIDGIESIRKSYLNVDKLEEQGRAHLNIKKEATDPATKFSIWECIKEILSNDYEYLGVKNFYSDPSPHKDRKNLDSLISLTLIFKDGSRKKAVSNILGYVMNDKGVTIDRIDLF